MATFTTSPAFDRVYKKLSPEQKALVQKMVDELVKDLNAGKPPRATLRVKPVLALKNVYEITWDYDGRAMFKWGAEIKAGHRHVDWLHVGTHKILP